MRLFSRRFTLPEIRFFNGFTDYHSHLLPGVDDGIQTMEKALQALDYFEQHGVRCIWLTPHIMEDIPNTTSHLQTCFEELKTVYRGSIELHLAAEYMLDTLFEKRLSENDLLPLEENRLLVETSFFNPPMDFDGLLKRIRAAGYFPLLAHPERYTYMTIKDFYRLKSFGVEFQLNLPSVTGTYGTSVRVTAEKLLQKNMYDFAGTDIHSLNHFRKMNKIRISIKQIRRLNILAVFQLFNNSKIQ
jgi:Capsular polysaccharide biosynthesis protein